MKLIKSIQELRIAYLGHHCCACGSEESLVIDHIIPLAKGGSFDDSTNIQTLCISCNASKGNSIMDFGKNKRKEFEKKCIQCKYKWLARKKHPKECPNCKRYDWHQSLASFIKNAEPNKPAVEGVVEQPVKALETNPIGGSDE